MLNSIIKFVTGKEIIIFHRHRNSNPLKNSINKKKYFFLEPSLIWKASALFGRDSRLRYRVMGLVFSFIDPLTVIDINWTSKKHSFYFAWCKKNGKKFIVIQHGIYYAGLVESIISEKYVKCTTHLVWGEHFKQMRERDNRGKNCEFIVFGNPVYNNYDRSKFRYKEEIGNKVLVAVSVIKGRRLERLREFLAKLEAFGFDVVLKEHNLQSKKAAEITGYKKNEVNLYDLLKEQRYDYVVTDISSAMTDLIFFKNRAIYFSPDDDKDYYTENVYEQYLNNFALRDSFFESREELLSFVSVEAQEELLAYLIKTEGVSNSLEQILD